MGYRKGTSDLNGLIILLTKVLSTNKFSAHVSLVVGVFLKMIFLDVINVCPLTDESKHCHLVLTHRKFNIQMVVSQFQIGTVPQSHYLKSGKFCTRLSPSIFLGSHRSCSPILTYKVIALSIIISLSYMFHLAFAASKNFIITQANFEDHIIKFGRLQFIERKCQCESFNINVNRLI